MNSVLLAVTRREPIPGGLAPASLLATVTASSTEFMSRGLSAYCTKIESTIAG